jgi:predicted transcriptional regulator of viral defense system
MTPATSAAQRDRIIELLERRRMARLSEILEQTGATAAAVTRLEREGILVKLSRGLYQLADSPIDQHHALAEAALLVPKGVVCLLSALAYHELTDRIPARVWLAIGRSDWRPTVSHPPLRILYYSVKALTALVEKHEIDGVIVTMTNPARTVVDCFKYQSKVGRNVAIEGLRELLRTRKATPAELQRAAAEMGQWAQMRPYVEAIAHDG